MEIGSATNFDMWNEPWVLDDQPRPPRPMPQIHFQTWTINDFKDNDSDQWHLHRLHQVFDAAEIARILQIKPGGTGSQQGFSWLYNESGNYSVKSGYRQWLSMKICVSDPVPEIVVDYSEIFRQVWTISTSPKLKNFLWRCLHKALPIGAELRKKRIAENGTCAKCGDENEDLVHLLFNCPCARALWSLSPFVSILTDSACSIQGKIFSCIKLDAEQHDDDKELWTWIMWRLWKMRNAKVFQNAQSDVVTAYQMARTDHVEWRSSQMAVATPENSVTALPPLYWVPPPVDVLKCNIDATWQDDHDRCGAAWVLRDSEGRVRFWGVKTYPKLLSPLDAEASALTWAVMCIGNMGYLRVIFESDSATLVETVNNSSIRSRLISYTTEIHSRMNQEHRQFSFCKIKRENNQVADCLAKYAKDLPMYSGTIDNSVPLWLRPFLDHTI